MLSPARQSVRLSVRHTGGSLRLKLGKGHFSPYPTVARGSPINVEFFRGKFHPEILTGVPSAGRQTREESKNKSFYSLMRHYFENGKRYVRRY